MTRADGVGGLLLTAFFAACLWEATSFQYGAEFAPGPGFAPVWLSAIGVVLSLLLAFNGFTAAQRIERSPTEESEPIDQAGLFRVGATLAGLLAMIAITPWLGLVSSIFVLLLFLTLYVQRLSALSAIGASAGTVFFVYLIFVHFLDVPIPSGPMGF